MQNLFPVLIFMLCDELLLSAFRALLTSVANGGSGLISAQGALFYAVYYHGDLLFLVWQALAALLSLLVMLRMTGQRPRDFISDPKSAASSSPAAPHIDKKGFYLCAQAVFLCLFFNAFSALFGAQRPARHYLLPELFVLCLCIPLIEEIVFRAVAYRELKVRTDERSALFISSILFGIHHGALLSALYAFCAGILLALFFRDRGGIRASFAAHACMNLLTLVLSASGALGVLSSPGFCAAFFGLLALSAALYRKEAG